MQAEFLVPGATGLPGALLALKSLIPVKRSRASTAMFRICQRALFPMMVVLVCALPLGADDGLHPKPTNASGKAHKTLPPRTAKQEQSALPLSPEQMPPRPPKVTYSDGQLTIIAENSSLADILSAVRSQTGVVIDLPPGSGSDRVASRMGPGPARDVLAALLNGSRFDYIMTGSPSNPAGVEHIILVPRGDGSESTSPMGNPAIAANLAGQQRSQQNVIAIGLAQQQPSQPDVTAETTSYGVGDADADVSEQPTRAWTSEAQEPSQGNGEQPPQPGGQQSSGWRIQQVFPQQPGTTPQQPENSPTRSQGSPTPLPPHN